MTNSTSDAGFEFRFSDTLQEIEQIKRLARTFLDRDTFAFVIPDWQTKLQQFQLQDSVDRKLWDIPSDAPIRTKPVDGDLVPQKHCGIKLHGEISTTWTISATRGTKKHRRRPETFTLLSSSPSSTKVCLVETEQSRTLAEWHFDVVSNKQAPGSAFHTQIKWALPDPLSSDLDIPRFPNMMVTPMDAVVFVLGELFQEKWTKHVTSKLSYNELGSLQAKRLTKALRWYLDKISGMSVIPWIVFADNRPGSELFTQDT